MKLLGQKVSVFEDLYTQGNLVPQELVSRFLSVAAQRAGCTDAEGTTHLHASEELSQPSMGAGGTGVTNG